MGRVTETTYPYVEDNDGLQPAVVECLKEAIKYVPDSNDRGCAFQLVNAICISLGGISSELMRLRKALEKADGSE